MKSEIIIRACEITEQHYRNMSNIDVANAFKIFHNSIVALEARETAQEILNHEEALKDSFKTHGQG